MPSSIPSFRTNVVLIDYENVQPKAQELAELAAEHFQVLVFVGAKQAKVPVDFAAELLKKGKPSELVVISGSGRNAADFHMAFCLGQLAMKEPEVYFHIISKDTGFDPLIGHLREEKRLFASRWERIGDIPLVKLTKAKGVDDRARLIIDRLRKAKSGRPGTRKALSGSIGALFCRMLSDEDIGGIISAMERLKVIAFNGERVAYSLPERVGA
jgi:hypothetical protein